MKIVCVSDTHLQVGNKFKIPDGDVLIHAGDATPNGRLEHTAQFADWLSRQPHKHKLFVAGNHDYAFQVQRGYAVQLIEAAGARYLEDSGVIIDGRLFWGSPWQPEFMNWAFNLPRGPELKRHWDLIPEGTDVLITHSPPLGILDMTDRGEYVGCEDLRDAVQRVRPKLHVFGHIHESHGQERRDDTLFVNAAICDSRYRPGNKPQVIELN
jgi:Icc-related predicted phosphoesterase